MSTIESSEDQNSISKYIKPLDLQNVNYNDIKTVSCFDLECLMYTGQKYKYYLSIRILK
jgi:hypothetical protein